MRAVLGAVGILLVASAASAEPTVLRCGRRLDARTGNISLNQVIVTDGGRIAAVRPDYEFACHEGNAMVMENVLRAAGFVDK